MKHYRLKLATVFNKLYKRNLNKDFIINIVNVVTNNSYFFVDDIAIAEIIDLFNSL